MKHNICIIAGCNNDSAGGWLCMEHMPSSVKLTGQDIEDLITALELSHHPMGGPQWVKRRDELIRMLKGD